MRKSKLFKMQLKYLALLLKLKPNLEKSDPPFIFQKELINYQYDFITIVKKPI